MLDLAAPLNLWALTAIAVPFIIHLWRRRNPRKIKFGSLVLLHGSRPSRFRSLSISNLPLLLLRVLILGALSLLIAQPFLPLPRSLDRGSGRKRWVLVDPDLLRDWKLGDGYFELEEYQFEQAINSLVADGWELRFFTHGFPSFAMMQDVAAPPSVSNYWSLIAEADRQAPDSTFFVFAPELAACIAGRRPTITSKVHWRLIPVGGTEHWIRDVVADDDTLHLTVGTGTRDRTRYSRFAFAKDGPRLNTSSDATTEPQIQVSHTEDGWNVELADRNGDAAKIRASMTDRWNAAVLYGPQRMQDARYIRSAVRAIADTSIFPIQVTLAPTARLEQTVRRSEIIFWLSAEPPQKEVLEWARQGSTLVSDTTSDSGSFSESWAHVEFAGQRERLRLWRRSETPPEGMPLWEDGRGSSLLTLREEGSGIWLHYNSRFHPTWSDLVLNPCFPEVVHWMLTMRSSPVQDSERELRGADPQQYSPKRETLTGAPSVDVSLYLPLWVLAAVLFVIERRVAERSKA